MNVQRIGLKYYVEDSAAVDLPALIPVFHRWIQQRSVAGLLIDVADYKHVHHGPGIVLVGHECEYRMDLGEGRPGLCYVRKRDTGDDFERALRSSLAALLPACAKLEQETALGGASFRTGEVLVSIFDRLAAPNTPETTEAVQADIQAVLAPLYGSVELEFERAADDPRECCAIRVKSSDAPALADLMARLGA
jgi:hypothetical protein